MTTLYPRLSDPDGRVLLARMRDLGIDALRAQSGTDHVGSFFSPTGGLPASQDHLAALARAVRDCATGFGYPTPSSARSGEGQGLVAFDRALSRVIYEQTDMAPAEASAADVWTFMAACLLPDVVKWRWHDSTNIERWLGFTLVRHTFARVWWQAYALAMKTDVGLDYRLLDALSESDLNQLFERRSIGGSPSLVRALAEALIDPRHRSAGLQHRDLVRDVTKRIRRLMPFTSFDALDDDELLARINGTVVEAAAALVEGA